MALAQQEDDVGAEAEFGVGVLAVEGQQFIALLGIQVTVPPNAVDLAIR